jgi:hypothetical protein
MAGEAKAAKSAAATKRAKKTTTAVAKKVVPRKVVAERPKSRSLIGLPRPLKKAEKQIPRRLKPPRNDKK